MFSKMIASLLLLAPLAVNGLNCYYWNFQDGRVSSTSYSTRLGYYSCSGENCIKHSFKVAAACSTSTTACVAYGYQWRGSSGSYVNGDYPWQTFVFGGCNEQTTISYATYWNQYGVAQTYASTVTSALGNAACTTLVNTASTNGAAYGYTVTDNECDMCGPACATSGACPDSFNSAGTATSGEGDYCNSVRVGSAASHGPSALVAMAVAAAARLVWQQ